MNVREWALPVYTILMQTATGSLSFLWVFRLRQSRHRGSDESSVSLDIPLTIILITIIFAMVGSHFHLSRPYLSLLAVTNLRSSWLSREILFTILLFLFTFSMWVLHRAHRSFERLIDVLGWLGIISGWAMVYCMARIYLEFSGHDAVLLGIDPPAGIIGTSSYALDGSTFHRCEGSGKFRPGLDTTAEIADHDGWGSSGYGVLGCGSRINQDGLATYGE